MATVLTATPSSATRTRFRITINFAMALLMAAIVIYGFSQTIGANLIHPNIPRPNVLYVHAALFAAFMAIYVLQTALVASHNVALHRRLGIVWIAVGAAMPVIGVATGIVMRRFDVVHFHDYATFIAVILWDMLAFSTLFLLAILWRKRPEYHRRFMFLATCGLMEAAFSRFPLIAVLPIRIWRNQLPALQRGSRPRRPAGDGVLEPSRKLRLVSGRTVEGARRRRGAQ
jgi:hypothetical protein